MAATTNVVRVLDKYVKYVIKHSQSIFQRRFTATLLTLNITETKKNMFGAIYQANVSLC